MREVLQGKSCDQQSRMKQALDWSKVVQLQNRKWQVEENHWVARIEFRSNRILSQRLDGKALPRPHL